MTSAAFRRASAPRTAATHVAPRSGSLRRVGGLARVRAQSRLAHVASQLLQRGDAVLDRRMGREQIVHAMAGEWIDDEQVRGRRTLLGGRILDLLCGARNLEKRRGEGVGTTAHARAEIVRAIFAG